jgi:hypothetical protein
MALDVVQWRIVHKDPGQECILAISVTRSTFLSLLRQAVVSTHRTETLESTESKKMEPENLCLA